MKKDTCRGKGRIGDRRAICVLENALRQQVVAEQACYEEVLSEKFLKQVAREGAPRDGIGDCSENPVQLKKNTKILI